MSRFNRKFGPRIRARYGNRPGRKVNTYGNIAKYALQGVRFIKTLLNVERKRNDVDLINVTDYNPTITLLTGIPLGTDYNERNGRSIKGYSNSLKYKVSLNVTTPTRCMVRMILFNDKASNGTAPTIADLLDQSTSGDYMIQHYNADNAGSRFRILADKRFQLDPNSYNYHIGTIYKKTPWHVKYDGSGNTISNTTTGHIYLMLVSDVATSATAPTVSYVNRFTYLDN